MPYQEKYDPIKNHNFRVTMGNIVFGFMRVSGLKASAEVVNYREGDDDINTPHKSAGLGRFDPLTMVKGLTAKSESSENEGASPIEFFNYIKKVIGATKEYRMDVTIEVLAKDKSVVRTYFVPNAWVSDYEMGELNAEGNEAFIRTLTLQHEGFEESVESPPGLTIYENME